MRYFKICADKKNILPNFTNWYSKVRPGIWLAGQVYEVLKKRNYLKVELNPEILFPDVISNPCFMVSKEFADLIRLYCPEIHFKYVILFDEKNKRTVSYQVPDLPEIDCLDDESELSRTGREIIKGVLRGSRTRQEPIFRLKGTKENYVMASLEFVESAYRREVRGMAIEEFIVR